MGSHGFYRYLFGKKEETPPPIPPRPPGKREPKSLIQQVIEFKKMGFSTICKNYEGQYGKGWMMGCEMFCVVIYEHAPMDWVPRFLLPQDLQMNGIYGRMEPKQLF
jgi:hypothetical protein